MKISIIALNSNLINTSGQTKIIDYLKSRLYEIGENVSLISYFANSLEELKSSNILSNDFVFVIGTDSSIYNNNIKENLCRIFSDKLENNDASTTSIKKYCLDNNIPFSTLEEMECMLPSKSIPLCDELFDMTGFMYKKDKTYIVYLPQNIGLVTLCYVRRIAPLIKDVGALDSEFVVLKCFGILEKDIKSMLSSYFGSDEVKISIRSSGLDSAIFIRYSSNQNKTTIQNIVSDICEKLNRFIYATEDISLYDMALDLLSLRGKKIIIGETLTLGNIARKLSESGNDRVSEAFIFTNTQSLLKYTKINPKIIENYGMYSVNTVYEIANSMLEMSSAEVVLFTLGDKNKSDTCFMAIGDLDGIHVYKNKINDKGEELIQNLSDTAVFYLIKKLKQNDLQM